MVTNTGMEACGSRIIVSAALCSIVTDSSQLTCVPKQPRERSWYNDWATGWATEDLQFDCRHREEVVFFTKAAGA